MDNANRAIARMWAHADGYECYVRKRGNDWLLTLEKSGTVLKETLVESPGDAIRQAEELRRTLMAAG